MDIYKAFKIDEALAKHRAEETALVARRARSTKRMFSHRPHSGRLRAQICAYSTLKQLQDQLPENEASYELIRGLREESMFLATETVLRPNREIIEFHNLDNQCLRCQQKLTSCHCRECKHLKESRFVSELHLTLRKLYYAGHLIIVCMSQTGLLHISNARSQRAPRFFPCYGMGTGFEIYARDYHLPQKKQ